MKSFTLQILDKLLYFSYVIIQSLGSSFCGFLELKIFLTQTQRKLQIQTLPKLDFCQPNPSLVSCHKKINLVLFERKILAKIGEKFGIFFQKLGKNVTLEEITLGKNVAWKECHLGKNVNRKKCHEGEMSLGKNVTRINCLGKKCPRIKCH